MMPTIPKESREQMESPTFLMKLNGGLDWLLKMYPSKDILYHQIADDREQNPLQLLSKDNADYGSGQGNGSPRLSGNRKTTGTIYHQKSHNGHCHPLPESIPLHLAWVLKFSPYSTPLLPTH